jgi:hypothetical protein
MRAALLAAVLAACSHDSAPPEQAKGTGATPAEPAPAMPADAAPAPAARKAMKIEPVYDEFRKKAEKAVKSWFARRTGTPESGVEVELLDEDDLPDAVLFVASMTTQRGRRGTGPDDREMPSAYGIYDGQKVIAETAAAQAFAARAWGYGPDRTVPPDHVARVFGFLESSSGSPAFAIYDQEDLEDLPSKIRKQVALPAETMVGGKPAVVYYVKERKAASFWRSTAVFAGGGAVEVKREEP